MFKLSFPTFVQRAQQLVRDKVLGSKYIHYLETDKDFTLFLCSEDGWQYFSVLTKDEIAEFGATHSRTRDQSVDDFRFNFLYTAVPIESNSNLMKMISQPLQKENELYQKLFKLHMKNGKY